MSIDLDKLTFQSTARKEEILAYILCGEYIFGDKETIIGDKLDEFCPDIYSKDKSVGAEVVVCESFQTFQKIAKLKLGLVNKVKPRSVNKKNIYLFKKDNYNNAEESTLYKENFHSILEKNLTEKLKKHNGINYDGCKNMNLIVLSCYKDKQLVQDEDIFKTCIKVMDRFKEQYENIYVCINNKILQISKYREFSILKDLMNKNNILNNEQTL